MSVVTELKMDEKHMPAVRSGLKKITIRTGYRPFGIGRVVKIVNASNPDDVYEVVVSKLKFTSLSQITEKEYMDDGFDSREDFESGIREYYPDVTDHSPMTVVRWK